MKPPTPPRVPDITTYWTSPPPEASERALYWIARIKGGWKPNRRLSSYGYYDASETYGVWIWEYENVIQPLLEGRLE